MQRLKHLLLLCFIVFMLASCGKSNTEGRNIPNGAALVIHVNGKSMQEKLPWEEVKRSPLFQDVYNDSAANAFIRSVLDDPKNSGIDVGTDLLFFVLKDSMGGYAALEGSVADEAKFEKFAREAGKDATTSTENDVKYSVSKAMTASWNPKKFIIVMDAPMFKNMGPGKMYDTAYGETPPSRNLLPVAKQLFNLAEKESLAKDDKFSELMKKEGDVHFWVNGEAMAEGNLEGASMGPLSMMNLKKLYEGSRITGTVNFDDGKILADIKSYSGKEMTELMKKFGGKNIDMDMVNRIPSGNLAAMFALNFEPEAIREYLKLLGLDGFANMASPMLGFNLDDFVKANKGDIILAVTDLVSDSSGKSNASVIFSASIGDKPSFDKLVTAGDKLSREKLQEDSSFSIFHQKTDKYFVIGNNQDAVNSYKSGTPNSSFDFNDRIKGSGSAAYINFQYILKNMGTGLRKDSFELKFHEASTRMWDNLLAYGTGNNTQHFEINLVDKKTNSLKQLNNYLNTIGLAKKRQDELYKNSAYPDSTVAAGQ